MNALAWTRAGRLAVLALAMLAAGPVRADKGHLWVGPVALREDAQRAILLHNGTEEVLILGIELSARTPADILEFIPFPSEPSVSAAPGEPFRAIRDLVAAKRLVIPSGRVLKGPASVAPVAVRFRARIGLHDVTVLRLQDAEGLRAWVEADARARKQPVPANLAAAVQVAEDYVRRGYPYFVLDHVPVGVEPRMVEPLAYRFKSARVYYPLRDSNLVGGTGEVELLMALPGTFPFEGPHPQAGHVGMALHALTGLPGEPWRLSSSAKVYPAEWTKIWPDAPAFFRGVPKLYLQALCYWGAFQFKEDLSLDPADLVPYACKMNEPFHYGQPPPYRFDGFTDDEIRDYCEANPTDPFCKAWVEVARPKPGKEPHGQR